MLRDGTCHPNGGAELDKLVPHLPSSDVVDAHLWVLCLLHYFDLNDAEEKLFSLMKSPNTVDGCKMVRHRVDKVVTYNMK